MKRTAIINNRFLRAVLLSVGVCATGLGILGIFLPLLPTVPLLLLGAACFARSSERFHQLLLNHHRLGPMIQGYLHGQGIPLRAKITAIGLIWFTISISMFVVPLPWVRLLLAVIGLGVTLYLVSLPVSRSI